MFLIPVKQLKSNGTDMYCPASHQDKESYGFDSYRCFSKPTKRAHTHTQWIILAYNAAAVKRFWKVFEVTPNFVQSYSKSFKIYTILVILDNVLSYRLKTAYFQFSSLTVLSVSNILRYVVFRNTKLFLCHFPN